MGNIFILCRTFYRLFHHSLEVCNRCYRQIDRCCLSCGSTYSRLMTAPPPPPSASASDAPPSCPVNSQSFQGSNLWSGLGPSFLTTASNAFQDQNGNHVGIYDIYGRLLLQNHCSIGAFALTMAKVNGEPITPDKIADWERDTLSAAAYSEALANAPSVKDLICLLAQPDNGLIDSWFSSAIITHPLSLLTTSTAPTTSGNSSESIINRLSCSGELKRRH